MVLLGVLLLGGGALLWQLEGERAERGPAAATDGEGVSPESATEAGPSLLQPRRQPTAAEPPPLPVARPSRLVVRVSAPQGGFSGEARVQVREAALGPVAELVLTAADPNQELECPPGEYVLVLVHPGPPVLGALPAHVSVAAGATTGVHFSLSELWSLSGRLADERELGLDDVPVALLRDERAVAETRTRPGGYFVLPPLPDGDYVLVVGDPLGPLVPRRTLHLDGELGDQELRVPSLLEIEVCVVDESGLAVPGAAVEGVGERGGRVAGVTDAEGRLRAALLPPGDYRLFARHPTLGRGNRVFALSGELTAPLEIQLLTGRPRR